ncbi:O-antigen/teichoic acid export membrane protein [Pasteurella langaaensis DSM 22999]|uniref:O-antigen/teichoic acid export membrane protein n=2 Tax=Alitibacter langaaensis TaxID=756 RepID=A0A2U0TA23_9PAST|nr:O-antigen/teichoic acid export membrane protein [Pasteurella langaaensis DSM 22999]
MKNNRHLLTLIAVTILSMGLTMVSSFILAHMLSVDDRGAHQLFITTVSYVVTIATGGSGFALALSMRNKQYWHWRRYFVSFLAAAIIVALIAIALFDFTDFKFLFVLNVILTAILTITLEKSKIDPRLKIYRTLTLQQPVLLVAIYGGGYLLFGEQPLEQAIQLLTLFSFIQGAACLFYLYKIEKEFKRKQQNITEIDRTFFFKTWFKQNLYQIFGATTSSIDKFLIVAWIGHYYLGLYTVCIAFDALLTKFINMLTDYYYSGLLNNYNRIKSVLTIIAMMGIGAVIFTPLLAEPIIKLFFSAKYIEVAPILIWFILNSIIAGLSWLLSQNMLIQGKQVLLFTRQLVSIAVFISLFYLLKDQHLYGVACAFIGASLTRLVISIIYYFKYPVTNSKVEQK